MVGRHPHRLADAEQRCAVRLLHAALTLFAHNGYAKTSTREIAEAAEVSVPFLSDLERGKRAIGPKRLDSLARALGLDPETYVKLFQLRGRLPPRDEAWLVQHPEHWPSRRKRRGE